MSRLLGYMGPPILLSSAIIEHPHSLVEQSYAPREMVTGTINADGFGVGWYGEEGELPGTYHRSTPIWSDLDLPRLGRVVRSRCIFAAVRNATPGFAVDILNVPPFVHQHLLFMHNGAVEGFSRRFRRPFLEHIPEEIQATTLASVDSEVLLALALTHLLKSGLRPGLGVDNLKAALDFTLRTVLDLALAEQARASLNMGLTDGHAMVFVRLARGIDANSLYLRQEGDAVWVASEPLEGSKDWKTVPPDNWVLVDGSGRVAIEHIADLPPKKEWS